MSGRCSFRAAPLVLRMALIDRDGTIAWHGFNRGSIDLRNQEQCSDFVGRMMDDFPRPGK